MADRLVVRLCDFLQSWITAFLVADERAISFDYYAVLVAVLDCFALLGERVQLYQLTQF